MNVQDRRRLLGPGNARPISFSASAKLNTTEDKSMNDEDNDAVFLRTGLVENCNGSSLVEFKESGHQTSLISSVYGPKALRGSFTSKASLSVQIKNGSSQNYSTSQLKELGSFLANVFGSVVNKSRYPKSGIDIFIHLMYDKDRKDNKSINIASIIPHCITGVTLALIDAGIEVLDMASGGHYRGSVFAFIKNGEEVTGFWKDQDGNADIQESLEHCKGKYLHYKSLMVGYLLQKQASESEGSV